MAVDTQQQKELIRVLEELVEKAKLNRLIGVAVVGIEQEPNGNQAVGSWFQGPVVSLGFGIAQLHHRFHTKNSV